jgi:enamine deaminase RidA (YjgF/YER057c/UK114 family)
VKQYGLPWISLGLLAATAQAEPMLVRLAAERTSETAAVVVAASELVHTTQILPDAMAGQAKNPPLDQQIVQVFQRLDALLSAAGTGRTKLVKLNLYVASAAVVDPVRAYLTNWAGEGNLPAVSWVETPLPLPGAQVGLDAICAVQRDQPTDLPTLGPPPTGTPTAPWCILPRGDVIYISGQAEPGDLATATRGTLDSLDRTLQHLKLDRSRIIQLKCFLEPMTQVETVNQALRQFFGEATMPPVVHVQWSGGTYPIEIEMIAHAPAEASTETVTYQWLPWLTVSPIYCRLARIHGDQRIYTAGLYSTVDGNGETQVRDIFQTLEQILTRTNSDLRHMAKATYYVSENDSSGQLNVIRPMIYDPKRPPAASKAMVQGVGKAARGITMDMIASPKMK